MKKNLSIILNKIAMKINIGSRTEIEASQMLFCVSDANYTKVFMNDGKVY